MRMMTMLMVVTLYLPSKEALGSFILLALKMSLWSYEADVINLFFSFFFFSGQQTEEELIARLPGSTLTVRRNV